MVSRASPTAVYLEAGAKRVFACAVDWPGWCRSGRGEEQALEALATCAARYAEVAGQAGIAFDAAADTGFTVTERVPGNATTDFGAPGVVPALDGRRLTAAQAERQAALVAAAWEVLDRVAATSPPELRKGPRGGGRDRDAMLDHVLAAETAYARKIGVRHRQPALDAATAIKALRQAVLEVLRTPSDGTPLAPNGWPSRYAARRIAWHVLDHAWEMEDRGGPVPP